MKLVVSQDLNGDGVLNAAEYGNGKISVVLEDLASGGLLAKDTITITGKNEEYTITSEDIKNNKVSFVYDIPKDDSISHTIVVHAYGKTTSYFTDQVTITLDTTPPKIEIDTPIEGDNVITASEEKDVVITGTTDAEDGQVVTVTITDKNGDKIEAQATVKDGKWTISDTNITPLTSGDLTVEATVSDKAGNQNATQVETGVTLIELVSSDSSISTNEDVSHTLLSTDFGNWKEQGAEVSEVKITELPQDGEIQVNGVAIAQDAVVSMSDIENGNVKFVPNANSDADGKFKFLVGDGSGEWSEDSYTTNITVEAVADAPKVTVETISHDNVTDGEGLSFTTYNNVLFQDLHPDDYVRNSNILESFADHYAEAYSGNTQIVSEIAPNSALAAQTMVGAKGYVYLEAGQQVTFSGTIDDSAMIKIGGEVVLYTTGDAYGSVSTQGAGTSSVGGGEAVSAGAFTVSQSGYYSLETYVLNSGGPGNYNIQMSVDGGATYKDINTKNFDLYATQADITEYAKNAGEQNTNIKLSDVGAELTDVDKSETLSINIKDIPEGATLSDGVNTFTATSTNTTADVKGWDLDNLTFNAPSAGVYTLNVVGTATEASNHDVASTTKPLVVSVTNFPVDDEAQFIPEKCGCKRDLQEDVNTGNANDYLVVGDDIGSSHTYASKHVEVNMNGGNDVIELDGAIDWYSRVNMGDGDDVIRSAAGSIKGDSIVDMGDGNDTITTQGGFYDRTEVNMGNGDDTVYARCNIDYDAKVNMGEGDDTVTLGGGMYDKASLTLGNGNDVVTMTASMNHHSNIEAGSGDDTLNVTKGSIRHNATVDMGDGNDAVNVHCHVGNNASINLGNGNDTMSVDGSLWDKSSINMGNGDDVFTLKGSANGQSNVDLGDGDDKLILSQPGCNIDLTKVSEHFDNVETLDISSYRATKVTLNVADIVDMTDDNNTIKIDGDSNDSVKSDTQWSWRSWSHESQDSWSFQGTENGYNRYVGTDSSGREATLLLDADIQTDF